MFTRTIQYGFLPLRLSSIGIAQWVARALLEDRLECLPNGLALAKPSPYCGLARGATLTVWLAGHHLVTPLYSYPKSWLFQLFFDQLRLLEYFLWRAATANSPPPTRVQGSSKPTTSGSEHDGHCLHAVHLTESYYIY